MSRAKIALDCLRAAGRTLSPSSVGTLSQNRISVAILQVCQNFPWLERDFEAFSKKILKV